MRRYFWGLLLLAASCLCAEQDYNRLGQLLLQQQRPEEAEQAFARAFKLTRSTEACENLMLLELLADKTAAAELSARMLLRLQPDNFNARLALSIIDFNRRRYADSLARLPASGQDPLVLALRTENLRKLGRKTAAPAFPLVQVQDALLAARLFRAPELQSYSISWLKQSPANAEALSQLGELYSLRGEWKEAWACYEQLLPARAQDARLLMGAAEAAERLALHEQARQYVTDAKRAAQGKPASLVEFAIAAVRLQLMLEAHDALTAAVALAPSVPNAHFQLALVSAYLGLAKTAEEQYRAALALSPGDARFRVGFGHFLIENGREVEARGELEAAAQSPDMEGHALHYLGTIYGNLDGDLAKARQALQKAVKLIPNDAETRADLAGVAITQGDLTAARVHIAAALRLDEQCAQAHFQKGRLLAKTGQLEDSKAETQLAGQLREKQRERVVTLGAK